MRSKKAMPWSNDKDKGITEIYFKGTDRNDADTARLITCALNHNDKIMLWEALAFATDDARKEFTDHGGKQRIRDVFGEDNASLDFAILGRLSPATGLKDNAGYAPINFKGILSDLDQARLFITRMTNEQRQLYADGMYYSQHGTPADDRLYSVGQYLADGKDPTDLYLREAKTEAQRKDYFQKARDLYERTNQGRTFFAEMNQALDLVSGSNPKKPNALKFMLHSMILQRGEDTLIPTLANHEHFFRSDSSSEISKEIERMTRDQFIYCKNHPELRGQVEAMLARLGLSDKDVQTTMGYYDAKMKVGKATTDDKPAYDMSKQEDVARANSDYENSQKVGRQDILTELRELRGLGLWSARKNMLDAFANMATSDQERYRSDKSYRKEVDEVMLSVSEFRRKGLDYEPEVAAFERMRNALLRETGTDKERDPGKDIVAQVIRLRGRTDDIIQLLERTLPMILCSGARLSKDRVMTIRSLTINFSRI